jgi:hypothetical protein
MCNQTVCLVAAELERQGISTVAIVFLKEVAQAVRPPRALVVPFKHGYPLGVPNEPQIQHEVIHAALSLIETAASGPALEVFTPSANVSSLGTTPS